MTIDGDEPAGLDDEAQRETTFARRALLRAGWIVPAVIVLDAAPAFAAGSVAPHTDIPGVPHTDTVAGHGDVPAFDGPTPHIDQIDPHTDGPIDVHVDVFPPVGPHQDFISHPHADSVPSHTDIPPGHADTVHDDTAGVHTDAPAQPHVDA